MSTADADQAEQNNSDIHQMIYRWDVRRGRFGIVASSFDEEKTRQWHERLAPWALPPGRGEPSQDGPDNPHEVTFLRFDDAAVLCFRSFGDEHAGESVTYVLVAPEQAANPWHALAGLQLRWLENRQLPVHLWRDRVVGQRSAGELLPDTTSARANVLRFADEQDKDDVVVLLAALLAALLSAPDEGSSFVVVADSARRLDLLTALLRAADRLKNTEKQTFTTLSVMPPDGAPWPRWIFLRPDQLDAGRPPGHPPSVREWMPEPLYRRSAEGLLGMLAPPRPSDTPAGAAPDPAGVRDETPFDVMIVDTEGAREWAVWIAWILEDAGYRVFLPAWDVLAGDRTVRQLDDASSRARHFFIVMSDDIHENPLVDALINRKGEHDDSGRRVVPVEVKEVTSRGYLDPRNLYLPIDIKTMGEGQAMQTLLRETFILFSGARRRPATPPAFPRADADVPPARPAALRIYVLARGAQDPEPRMPPYPARRGAAARPLSAEARAAARARAEEQADAALTAAIHDTFAAFSEHVSATLDRAGASLAEAETYDDVRRVLVDAVGDTMCLRGHDLDVLRRLVGLRGPAGLADDDPRPDQRPTIAARARAAAREPHPGHALAVTLAVDRFVERVLAAARPEITQLAAQAANRTVDQTVAAVEDLITRTARGLTRDPGDLDDPVESGWKAGLPAAVRAIGRLSGLASAARARLSRIRTTRFMRYTDEVVGPAVRRLDRSLPHDEVVEELLATIQNLARLDDATMAELRTTLGIKPAARRQSRRARSRAVDAGEEVTHLLDQQPGTIADAFAGSVDAADSIARLLAIIERILTSFLPGGTAAELSDNLRRAAVPRPQPPPTGLRRLWAGLRGLWEELWWALRVVYGREYDPDQIDDLLGIVLRPYYAGIRKDAKEKLKAMVFVALVILVAITLVVTFIVLAAT